MQKLYATLSFAALLALSACGDSVNPEPTTTPVEPTQASGDSTSAMTTKKVPDTADSPTNEASDQPQNAEKIHVAYVRGLF